VCQTIGGEDLLSEPSKDLVNSRGLGVKRPRTYKFDKMLKGKKKICEWLVDLVLSKIYPIVPPSAIIMS
jgi:hypothetical protein